MFVSVNKVTSERLDLGPDFCHPYVYNTLVNFKATDIKIVEESVSYCNAKINVLYLLSNI